MGDGGEIVWLIKGAASDHHYRIAGGRLGANTGRAIRAKKAGLGAAAFADELAGVGLAGQREIFGLGPD